MPKTPTTAPRPAWIVHRISDQGQPKTPRRKPMKVHHSEASALAEANRLAALCCAPIAVFEQVAVVHPPTVLEPLPDAPLPKPAPALSDMAPTAPKPAARTVSVETRRRLRKPVISRKDP